MKASVKKAMARAHPKAHRGASGAAQHSSRYSVKVDIRRRVIEELGGIAKCSVLETHAGPGVMRHLCYVGAAATLACDENPESPDAVHCDSKLLLRSSSLDLQRFNFFDVDPFGSPFEHLWLIAKRRPIAKGERLGLMITCGSLAGRARMAATIGDAPTGLPRRMLPGVGVNVDAPTRLYTMENGHLLLMRAVSAWFSPATISTWVSHVGRTVRYDGVVLVG